MAKEDMEKTDFICHVGQFDYNRVGFVLANAPSHFQRAMNKVLAPLLGRSALVYIDDLVVLSPNKPQHEGYWGGICTTWVVQFENKTLQVRVWKAESRTPRVRD